jgi:shikimate kinase
MKERDASMSNGELSLPEKNLILIGFMGVGKTTIGTVLAKKLNRDFIDVDREIEKRHGMPVTEIFKTMGEKHFRQLEKEYIVDLCRNSEKKVISLGGGAFMQEEIRDVCLAASLVIFLDLSWEAWKERLPMIIDSRPVLQNKSIQEMEDLYRARQHAYSLNHLKVSTDRLTPEQVADSIIESIDARMGQD